MDDISIDAKRPHVLAALEAAKEKGVTALKFELEAQLGRDSDTEYCDNCDEGHYTCDYCSGGYVECSNCDGSGRTENEQGHTVSCDPCEGDGSIRCSEECDEGYLVCGDCEGDWQSSSGDWGTGECLRQILMALGINDPSLGDGSHGYAYHRAENEGKADWLQYMEFYNDGSVDSELTFTIRLDNTEDAFKALDIMKAFTNLGEEISGTTDFDVQGAGMHTSFLFSPDCDYPVIYNWDTRSLQNFVRAINQLIPSLYFLAAPANGKNWTRGMNFRRPGVGMDGNKYSTIYVNNGAMEFRVFDTCYDNPSQLLDNLIVMSNCLRFYDRAYRGPQLYRKTGQIRFGNDSTRTLDRLYMTEDNLEIMTKYLKYLKPAYYSVAQLRKQRGFKVTKASLRKREQQEMAEAELGWKEYDERFKIHFKYYEKMVKYTAMQQFVENVALDDLRGMSQREVEAKVQENIESTVRREKSRKVSKTAFITSHMDRYRQQLRGGNTIHLR